MKKVFALAAVLNLVLGLACYQSRNNKAKADMRPFFGTYTGVAPSDESPISMGEIEVVVGKTTISIRRATGTRIAEEQFDTATFEPMAVKEVVSEFTADSPLISRAVGFQKIKSGAPKLIFIKDPAGNEFALIVRDGFGDLMGPTVLFSPAQVQGGVFERGVAELETKIGKDVLPRLKFGGKAK